jgi:hypothetical protein
MRQPSQLCRFFLVPPFILCSRLPLSPPACRLWRSVNERADGSGGNCCKAEAAPGGAGLERLGSPGASPAASRPTSPFNQAAPFLRSSRSWGQRRLAGLGGEQNDGFKPQYRGEQTPHR